MFLKVLITVRKKGDKMANSFGVWGTDAQTRLHFRIITIQKGMTGAQLLREMVAKEWVNEGKKALIRRRCGQSSG